MGVGYFILFFTNFLKFFFYVDHFKSLYWICYNIASVLCFGVFWPKGIWDLSSPTRDWTCTPCLGRWSFNHWTTREVPYFSIKMVSIKMWMNRMFISSSICSFIVCTEPSAPSPPDLGTRSQARSRGRRTRDKAWLSGFLLCKGLTVLTRVLLLKVWSVDQEHWHHLGAR